MRSVNRYIINNIIGILHSTRKVVKYLCDEYINIKHHYR